MCRMASASLVTAPAGTCGAPVLPAMAPEPPPPPPQAVSAASAAAMPSESLVRIGSLVSAEDRVQRVSGCGTLESIELSLFGNELRGAHESAPGRARQRSAN